MSSTRKPLEHIVPAYRLLPEGADTEAAEAAQPAQAAQSTQAAEAAPCTEAAAAAQSEDAEAAEEDAEAAAVSGLQVSGSASWSSLRSRLRPRESFIVRDAIE